MALLNALTRASVEDPSTPLTSTGLLSWLSGGNQSSAGTLVTERTAYGLTAYYRAIAIIAGTMAGLPLKTYHRGSRQRVHSVPVLDYPNPRHKVPFMFWQTMFANALSWGRMTAIKERNGADVIVRLWPIHPSKIRVEEVERTQSNLEGLVFLRNDKYGTEHRMTTRDVLHIPYMSIDGITGLTPIQIAVEALGTGIAAEKTAGKFYKNGSQLSGILSTDSDLTQTQATALQSRWAEKNSGADAAGRVAVLDNGANFSPISIPPKDAELLASRKWTVTEVARMFGLPPHMLGDIEKSSSWGTGIEQQMLGFAQFTLKPWVDLIEQVVTAEVLPGGPTKGSWYSEYSMEGLLRGDAAARAQFYASGIQWGWMNRNEARRLENLEAEEGLDEFIVPSNMNLVTVNGQVVPMTEQEMPDAST